MADLSALEKIASQKQSKVEHEPPPSTDIDTGNSTVEQSGVKQIRAGTITRH